MAKTTEKQSAERRAELLTKLHQAGFSVLPDGSIGEVVALDGRPLDSFDNKFVRAYLDRGNGSAGLLVNYFCIRAQLPSFDGTDCCPF